MRRERERLRKILTIRCSNRVQSDSSQQLQQKKIHRRNLLEFTGDVLFAELSFRSRTAETLERCGVRNATSQRMMNRRSRSSLTFHPVGKWSDLIRRRSLKIIETSGRKTDDVESILPARFSHRDPVQELGHWHMYELATLVHVPPFKHGELAQAFSCSGSSVVRRSFSPSSRTYGIARQCNLVRRYTHTAYWSSGLNTWRCSDMASRRKWLKETRCVRRSWKRVLQIDCSQNCPVNCAGHEQL